MKKFSIAMAVIAAMILTACNNDNVVVIRLNETQIELVKGSTKQLTATILPSEANPTYEWFSSMPEYVSVSETGLVKAEKLYYKNPTDTEVTPVTIYCKYNGGAAECKVIVTPLDVETLQMVIKDHNQEDALTLEPGQTKEFYVNYTPEDADIDFSKLEWSTSNFRYVSVKKVDGTASAIVTANWAGSARITARYSKLETSEDVIVSPIPATAVTIANKSQNTVVEGFTLQLSASFTPANATVEKVWTIKEGSEYATISDNGLLTALKPGTVVVKVSAGLVSDEITIEIQEAN